MSGVNAHALFTEAELVAELARPHSWQYRRQSYWPIPTVQHLLGKLQPARDGCTFAMDLCKSELAYLGDHLVMFTATYESNAFTESPHFV